MGASQVQSRRGRGRQVSDPRQPPSTDTAARSEKFRAQALMSQSERVSEFDVQNVGPKIVEVYKDAIST